jgi:hypothetical protein
MKLPPDDEVVVRRRDLAALRRAAIDGLRGPTPEWLRRIDAILADKEPE